MVAKLLGVLCATVIIAACVGVWLHADASAKRVGSIPGVEFVQRHWDFGVVELSNTELKHRFEFVNKTNHEVSIIVAGTGCNCLAVDAPENVAPGEHGIVTVRLETRGREGPFRTHVLLEVDGNSDRQVALTLEFDGEAPVSIAPEELVWTKIDHESAVKGSLSVTVDADPVNGTTLELTSLHPAIVMGTRNALDVPGLIGASRKIKTTVEVLLDTALLDRETTSIAEAVRVRYGGITKTVPVRIAYRYHPALEGPRVVTLRCGQRRRISLVLVRKSDQPARVTPRTSSADVSATILKEPVANGGKEVVLELAAPEEARAGSSTDVELTCANWADSPYHFRVRVLP